MMAGGRLKMVVTVTKFRLFEMVVWEISLF
jgi:hypothetical protein